MYELDGLFKKTSGKAQQILLLVKERPGLTAREIQKNMNIKTGNTFYKHVAILLEEKLLKNEINIKDKREKQYQLTKIGKKLVELIEKRNLRLTFKGFLHYCGKKYLMTHPEIKNTGRFDTLLRNPENVSLEFIEQIKELTEKYIEKYLTQ